MNGSDIVHFAMDLFEYMKGQHTLEGTPLAERLRPKTLNEILGQLEYLDQGSPLRRLLEQDQIPSMIVWGPPGSGKTSLAMALANQTNKVFVNLNAVDTGSKALKELGEESRNRRHLYQKSTLVFIDEIHRLNKAQQDVLLSFIEKGDFVLIGATTENPSFQINAAVLSRCRLLVFKRLNHDVLLQLLERAFSEAKLQRATVLSDKAMQVLMEIADGDGRKLLNCAEQVITAYILKPAGITFPLSRELIPNVLGSQALYHDRKGDSHYDTISAFIKSIRGSDADAGLYYLARLVESGEDPLFIARRLVILASEDVGNADPRALQIAVAGQQAVDFVGLPEAAINLAQVVTYLACAPKSNRSYMGLKLAQEEVKKSGALAIPNSVRNAPTKMMKNLGYSKDYQYAHNGERGWLPQQFLPDEIKDKKFYEPSSLGYEKSIRTFLDWLKGNKQNKSE